jgi:hypothetical protein
MAVKTVQVTQSGLAKQVSPLGTYARWIMFQNTAGAAMRLGDANVTASLGMSLAATGVPYFLQPMPDGLHYDLGQWYTIGTNTQLLDIVYDAIN